MPKVRGYSGDGCRLGVEAPPSSTHRDEIEGQQCRDVPCGGKKRTGDAFAIWPSVQSEREDEQDRQVERRGPHEQLG
jgi:hypothetical protein